MIGKIRRIASEPGRRSERLNTHHRILTGVIASIRYLTIPLNPGYPTAMLGSNLLMVLLYNLKHFFSRSGVGVVKLVRSRDQIMFSFIRNVAADFGLTNQTH